MHRSPSTYLNLKTFGSLSFPSTPNNNRIKFEPRPRKCVFLGYKIGIKRYVVLDTNNRKMKSSPQKIHRNKENSNIHKRLSSPDK